MRLGVAAALLFLVAGCQGSPATTVSGAPSAAPTVAPSPIAATCGDWERLSRSDRRGLIAAVIDAEGLIEGVRQAQHMAPTASRDALIDAAVGSIDKNCMLIRDPVRSIVELARAIYR